MQSPSSQLRLTATPHDSRGHAPFARTATTAGSATMDPKQIADGFMDVCRRLGNHAEQAETTLSTVGDERWESGHMIEFRERVELRARAMLRNRPTGSRPRDEYHTPLVGGDKLSTSVVPELVHTKGDGIQVFMEALRSQPLHELERSVPHGLRQAKLFEALIQHEITLPRAFWLIKIIFLNRSKASAERTTVWTNDVCQYVSELLHQTFANAKPRDEATASTRDALRSREDASRSKWEYVVALVRWSISAGILDQEMFLMASIAMTEKARETFGVHCVAAVVCKLLPLLSLLVPFATRKHNLTCRLANVCISALRREGAFSTSGSVRNLVLDNSSVATILEMMQGLLVAAPDAFVTNEISIPTIHEIRGRYPDVHISVSLAADLDAVLNRVESLRRVVAPPQISRRSLDVHLLLDRMLGGDHANIETFITTCQALKSSSKEQDDALHHLVFKVCEWATGANATGPPSTRRQRAGSALLRRFKRALKLDDESSNVPAKRKRNMSPNRVETAMFGWFDEVHGGMEVDSKYFAQRSELFHILVRDDVTSFDSMLLHIIANGTMESDDALNRTSFYAALILRYMPHEKSCINDPNQKRIRNTCVALLECAQRNISLAEKTNTTLEVNAIREEVKSLVDEALAKENEGGIESLLRNDRARHPFIRLELANQFSSAAAKTVSGKVETSATGLLYKLGFVDPLAEFLKLLPKENGTHRQTILKQLSWLSCSTPADIDKDSSMHGNITETDPRVAELVKSTDASIPIDSSTNIQIIEHCNEIIHSDVAIDKASTLKSVALILRLVAGCHLPLVRALSMLASDNATEEVRFLWLLLLFGCKTSALKDPVISESEFMMLESAITALPAPVIVEAMIPVVVSFLGATCSDRQGQPTSPANVLKSVFGQESIAEALRGVPSLLSLVKASGSVHLGNVSAERITQIMLRALNDSAHLDSLLNPIDRAREILCALSVSRLSFQCAELKILCEMLHSDARARDPKLVSDTKDAALLSARESLSNIIFCAAARTSDIVLLAEVVVYLDVKLASVLLEKLRVPDSYDGDDGSLSLCLLSFGGSALSSHVGPTIGDCLSQLDSLCAAFAKQENLRASVSKNLKLLLPLLGFVLGNKFFRQELCAVLLKLLCLPGISEAADSLIVLFCVCIGGHAPPWHGFVRPVPALSFTLPPDLVGMRPAVRARLEAGVNLSRSPPERVDPWTLVDGGVRGGQTGKAADFLQGAKRVPRSDVLL